MRGARDAAGHAQRATPGDQNRRSSQLALSMADVTKSIREYAYISHRFAANMGKVRFAPKSGMFCPQICVSVFDVFSVFDCISRIRSVFGPISRPQNPPRISGWLIQAAAESLIHADTTLFPDRKKLAVFF